MAGPGFPLLPEKPPHWALDSWLTDWEIVGNSRRCQRVLGGGGRGQPPAVSVPPYSLDCHPLGPWLPVWQWGAVGPPHLRGWLGTDVDPWPVCTCGNTPAKDSPSL